MKKYFKHFTLLLTIMVLSTFGLFSQETTPLINQTAKGKIIADFDIGLHFQSQDLEISSNIPSVESSVDLLDLEIDFGYAIIDNFVVGVFAELDKETKTTTIPAAVDGSFPEFEITDNFNLRTFGLFGRYYFSAGQFKPQVGVLVGSANFKADETDQSTGLDTENESTGMAFGGQAGFTYFFNNHVGINVVYQLEKLSLDNTTTIPGTSFETTSDWTTSKILVGATLSF